MSQTELNAGAWEYSKEEVVLTDKSTGADFAAAGFTHLITAHPKAGAFSFSVTVLLPLHLSQGFVAVEDKYDEVGAIEGYAGIRRPLWPPTWPLWRLEPQLWLMARRDAE